MVSYLLVDYALMAPLCALAPLGKDSEIHAATMEGFVEVIAGHALFSPCGRKVKLLSVPVGSEVPIPWPISTRGLPTPFSRCPKCWEMTGRKRPAARFNIAQAARGYLDRNVFLATDPLHRALEQLEGL